MLACRVCICPPNPPPPSQLRPPARPLAEPDSAPTTRRGHSGPERGLPPPSAFWDSGGVALHGWGRVACMYDGISPPRLWACRELCGPHALRAVQGRGQWRPRGPVGPRRQGAVRGAPGKWGAWYLGASLRAYLPRSSAVAPPSNALLGYLGRWVARRTLQLSPQTNPRPVVLQATPTCPLELRNAIWGLHVPSFLPDTAILAVHLHRPPRVAW